MINLQCSGESGYKEQDYETTTQHIELCEMMVDTKIQNKTLSLLLNVILGISGTDTMIN